MVLSLKINIKDAQKAKEYLQQESLLNKQYRLKREKKHIFLAIRKEFSIPKNFENAKIVKKNLEKIKEKPTLKSELSKKLNKEDFDLLKTAHDIVGDIAILEIPDELKKKEKLIANTLLNTSPRIKTVVKKADFHGTIFRTQKTKHLAGVKTTETIHRENNINLKLDIEKVYYSARSSTERRRITDQIKKGESVLVMFSGAAPFVCAISKNTLAKEVYGIELNPTGHYYGVENIRINKLKNARLILGDVKEILPKIHYINIGQKSHWKRKNLKRKIELGMRVIELYIEYDEWIPNRKQIENALKFLEKNNIMVHLHTCMHFKGKPLDIGIRPFSKEAIEFMGILYDLSKQFKNIFGFGIHSGGYLESYKQSSKKSLINNLLSIKKTYPGIFDYLYLENCIASDFFSNMNHFEEVFDKTGLNNMIFDLAHFYLSYYNTNKMRTTIKRLKDKYNIYFHIADSKKGWPKIKDAHEIGTGEIEFEKIADLIDIGVIEVWDYKPVIAKENERSYKNLIKLKKPKKFDRILMPLPKSADTFLKCALKVAKKGTIIHFYDFLREEEFQLAHKKIEIACKKAKLKHKILRTVKCGHYSPGTFRVCVDFKIL